MADLDGLKALHAWMREVGCLYAKCDGLELRLNPVPLTLAEPVDDVDAHARAAMDLERAERTALEELLMSGDEDALEAVLSLNKRVA